MSHEVPISVLGAVVGAVLATHAVRRRLVLRPAAVLPVLLVVLAAAYGIEYALDGQAERVQGR